MNPDTLKWFQTISINLGVAGVLFFLLFVGYIPSPLVVKLDAHMISTNELARAVHQLERSLSELDRTVKVLCGLTANANKFDSTACYIPPAPARHLTP
jgi:hypothetical protein